MALEGAGVAKVQLKRIWRHFPHLYIFFVSSTDHFCSYLIPISIYTMDGNEKKDRFWFRCNSHDGTK